MQNKLLNNPQTCATINLTSSSSSYQAPKAQFIPIVVDGKLAFKFDPTRGLIEWQYRGDKHIIDLATYR